MRDARLRRLVAAHLLNMTAEWVVIVGALIHAFSWGGARAVGAVSIAVSLTPLVSTPLAALALARWQPLTVRCAAFAIQALAYGAAAITVTIGAAAPIATLCVLVGLAAISSIHPSGAALLPRVARSTEDLVTAMLWVSYSDSASALVGSLVAGVAVGAGGPELAFFVGAVEAALALGATLWRPAPLTRTRSVGALPRPRRVVRTALGELRANPLSRGVVGVSSARNVIVGAFNILLVIMAIDALGLGDGGPGYLNALVGVGTLASTVVIRTVVRRARLRGALMSAPVIAAGLAVVLATTTRAPVVYAALPLVGVCMGAMDALSRTLLQRSSDPRHLGSLMAALGFIAGLGQLIGAVVAQISVAIGGLRAALGVLSGVLVALAAVSINSLRRADASADVPAMEMTLLAGLPMLASLPTDGLERVARLATTIAVHAGDPIMTEGESGDACFVIADGQFQISSKGVHRRVAGRGDVVGEVALLANIPRTSTVSARTSGSVLRIGRDAFLAAVTGHDVSVGDSLDQTMARQRYRKVISAHEDDPRADAPDQAESWLGLGAAGRALADPTYARALAKSARLAQASGDTSVLGEAAAMATWPGAFFFIADNSDPAMIALCEDALAHLADDDPTRVRVLTTLASHLTFTPVRERRVALIGEAADLARRHGDPALVGAVLNAEFICLWEPETHVRRSEIAGTLTAIAVQIGDGELEHVAGFFMAFCDAEAGRLDAARRRLVELRALQTRSRNQYFEFIGERLMLSIDIARGGEDLPTRIDALAERHGATHADTTNTWSAHTGFLAYQAGTMGSLVPMLATMTDGPLARLWQSALAMAHVMNGDTDAARLALAEQGPLPKNYFWLSVMQGHAEAAAELKMVERCAELFEELRPFRGQLGITASGSMCFALVSRSLGQLALALERYDEAIDLLTEAAHHADEIAMAFDTVICRRLLAATHRAQGRDATALRLIGEALPMATKHGFGREARLLSEMLQMPVACSEGGQATYELRET